MTIIAKKITCGTLCTINKTKMKKISILDRFATDAINAPAAVTGGGGKCGGGSKAKSKKAKSQSKKSKSKKSKSGGGCTPPPPPCY